VLERSCVSCCGCSARRCARLLTFDVAEELVQCLDVRVHDTHDERATEEELYVSLSR